MIKKELLTGKKDMNVPLLALEFRMAMKKTLEEGRRRYSKLAGKN